jgi:HTH-type transcriptional regulator / antitoxin HigA
MNASIKTAITYWPRVAPVLTPPRTKADFKQVVEALDVVLDAGGADEKHPLVRLADYLGDLIAEYEAAHRPKKETPVPHLLRELMRQYSLRQSDLPEVGPQSVVSDVLRGKRQLNVRQIGKLAKRFKLPTEVFMR